MRSDRRHAFWVDENYPHFITTVTKNRIPIFNDQDAARIMMEEFRFYSQHYTTKVLALVVMSDHVHCIIWPQGKHNFSDFMRGVKGHFAKTYSKMFQKRQDGNKAKTMDIWQDSFFDFLITSEEKLNEKIQYIRFNPVEDGLVQQSEDYPFLYVHPDFCECAGGVQ